MAVNLAYELAAAAGDRQPLLLADLDHVYGAVGAYLGLNAEHGLLDLLGRSGPIDGELINTTALSAPGCPQLKVLVSTATAGLGDVAPQYDRLGEATEACRQAYRVTVLDAPRVPLAVAAELAKAGALTILAFQLSVKDIRMARAMLSALIARGAPPESIMAAVTRYRRRTAMIELEEAKRVLGGTRVECFSNDFQAVAQSANYGQPLAKAAPRSPLRKELQQLASQIFDGSLARSKPVVMA
jgi:Flp pilus assembly CpaE family ATPase